MGGETTRQKAGWVRERLWIGSDAKTCYVAGPVCVCPEEKKRAARFQTLAASAGESDIVMFAPTKPMTHRCPQR